MDFDCRMSDKKGLLVLALDGMGNINYMPMSPLRPSSIGFYKKNDHSRNPHIGLRSWVAVLKSVSPSSAGPCAPASNDSQFFFRSKYHMDHKIKQNSSRIRANKICKRPIPKKNWSRDSAPWDPGEEAPCLLLTPTMTWSCRSTHELLCIRGQGWGKSNVRALSKGKR